ncbi:MAG: SAM-dependent DNA methyltransferase [Bacteroidetes bacterium]|nr:SAM-dependent DNA methyltransferase [Bacteroidota bacterium]
MTDPNALPNRHIKSRQRIADHGEVFTAQREVRAMIELVNDEAARIDSRFLEPACGTGNFLAEILSRKLRVVYERYRSSPLEYERYAILALTSIYGIDILPDNVDECRQRLYSIWDAAYSTALGTKAKDEARASARFILSKNILWGDALSLRMPGGNDASPIVFSEWSAVNGSLLKRRDFELAYLLEPVRQLAMFSDENQPAHIAEPVREYPLVHYLNIAQQE